MQKITIKNVKDAEYMALNLNKAFQPDKQHKQAFEFERSTVSAPTAEGGGQLAVNFYTLQPGKASYPYHYHTGSEEVFYIISGQGTLKTPDGEKSVKEGDVMVMPANENGAHMLINTSDSPLCYLDVDTVHHTEVAFYPETGKTAVFSYASKFKRIFKTGEDCNYLEGE